MARTVHRLVALLVALFAAVGTAAAPAWAAGADLAALSRDGRQGTVGQTVSVPLGIANHGPDLIGGREVVLGFRAPAGTVIVRAGGATNCEFNQARTTARCQLGSGWRVGVAAQPKGSYQDLQLKIVAKVTAPGTFTVACECDPKKANNATAIVLNGVTKPQPGTSPKPSARPRSSASPSPQQSLSLQETFEPDYGSQAPVAAESPAARKDSSTSGFMLIGVGAVLFGLIGLGGAAFLWRDRSGGEEDDTE